MNEQVIEEAKRYSDALHALAEAREEIQGLLAENAELRDEAAMLRAYVVVPDA